MAHVHFSKGLSIPIQGAPERASAYEELPTPSRHIYDLRPFSHLSLRLLRRKGDAIAQGEPLACDKEYPVRVFPSPASGVIEEICRGKRRIPLSVTIRKVEGEEERERRFPLLFPLEKFSREQILEQLLASGLFSLIKRRPFSQLADPREEPKSIFISLFSSEPFAPHLEDQIGEEGDCLQLGLDLLRRLTKGEVHVVGEEGSAPLLHTLQHVSLHTVSGPYPAGTLSLPIHCIDPICSSKEVIWTLQTEDLLTLGYFVKTGRYRTKTLFSIAGEGIAQEKRKYVWGRRGHAICELLSEMEPAQPVRYISGSPLSGSITTLDGGMGIQDNILTLLPLPKEEERTFLHFFRRKSQAFTATSLYAKREEQAKYTFSTALLGEKRFFLDASIYDRYFALPIPVIPLIQALMTSNFSLAKRLGFWEVESEDFILPTFICPCKIDLVTLVRKASDNLINGKASDRCL